MKIIIRIIIILGILLLGLFYYLTSYRTNELNLIINPNNRPEIMYNEETRTIKYKYLSENDLTVTDFFASSNAKLMLYHEEYPIDLIKFDLNNASKHVYAIIDHNNNQLRYEIVFDLSKAVLVFDEQDVQIGYIFKNINNKINQNDLNKLVANASVNWYADQSFMIAADLSNYSYNKIYAKPDSKLITVSFNANDGSDASSIKLPINSSLSNIPVLVKEGYEFIGWFDSVDGGMQIDLTTTFSSDIMLYAKFEVIDYTIAYYSDDSLIDVNNPASYNVESTITLLGLEKEGYKFVGWFDSLSYTNKIDVISNQTGNLNLYAKFEVISYTITYFNVDNLLNDNPSNYSIIAQVVFNSLVKEGYTFIGWSLSNDSNQLIYNTNSLLEDINLYAIWQADNYSVSYYLDGGVNSVDNPLFITITDRVVLNDAIKEGYIFTGWFSDETFTNRVVVLENQSSNLVLYAKYEVINYTITYDLDGGINSFDNVLSFTINDVITLSNPTKEGYTFIGWFDSPLYINKIEVISNQSDNLVLYAKWSKDGFSITYHLDGGINDDLNPTIITVTDVIVLNPAMKDGYQFVGWYTELSHTNKVDIISNQIGNLNLYAKYEIINYTIIYYLGGGINDDSNPTIITVTDVIVLNPAMKDGYHFIGWFNGSENVTTLSYINSNITLQAEYQIINYTITYHLAGGINSFDNVTSFTIHDVITLSNPTKEGYQFVGWYTELSHTNKVDIISNQVGNLNLYAKYEIINYIITYNLDGGVNSADNVLSFTINDVITLSNPTKEGYTFIGWFDSPLFINKIEVISNQSDNLVLYAKWSKDGFSITYHLDGGINDDLNPTIITVTDVIVLNPAMKDGYQFVGWYTELSHTNKVDIISNQIGNLNLYAKFEVINYTIIYYLGGGINDTNNPDTYNIASTITLNNPTKEGYQFVGWYTELSYTNKVDIISNQVGNLNLYAKYETINYIITYNLDGGINDDSNPTVITITDVIVLNPAMKDGYHFIGWFNGSENVTTLSYINSNITLQAEYQIINYTITYHLAGGINSFDNVTSFTIHDVITLSNPTKEGYQFVGWYTELSYTNKIDIISNQVGNLNLYAKYEIINYTITYQLAGGTNDANNPATYNIESYNQTLKPGIKNDYIFEGWYLNGEPITTISYFGYDIIVTAKFIPMIFIFEPYQTGYKIVGVTSAINDFAAVTIPKEYQNKPVLRIDDYALSYLTELKELTIPNSVVSIGSSILIGTTNLQTLTIPFIGETKDSANGVVGYLFGSLLTQGNIKVVQDNNTYYLPELLTTIRVTDAITIANHAFNNMTNLLEVSLNDQINKIGNFAFNNTTSLETFNLPLELKTIGNSAFFNTGYNKELVISANVNAIGAYAFYNAKLTRIISYATLNAFETNTFGNLPQLEQLIIYNVISITSNVIVSNPKLTKISLMDNVRTINFSALSSNKALKELQISNSVTSIAKGALHGLEALETLIIPFVGSSQTPTLNNEAGTLGFIFGTISYNNSNFINQVYNEAGNLFTGFYIPKTLKHLSITNAVNLYPGALYGLATLETISLNEGVITIYAHALSGIKKVNKLVLPSSVTKINNYSLANSNFEELFINSDQIQFGNNVFNNTTLKLMIKESSYDTIVSAITTQVVGSGVITTFKQE